eukprot:1142608-Pelagomonas_calceolata.AAC.6
MLPLADQDLFDPPGGSWMKERMDAERDGHFSEVCRVCTTFIGLSSWLWYGSWFIHQANYGQVISIRTLRRVEATERDGGASPAVAGDEVSSTAICKRSTKSEVVMS